MKPPHIKAQRKKEIRQIEKRRDELYENLRKLGFEKLEQPIRHGWYRVLIITDDVQNHKNKAAILEIYKNIITEFWGSTKRRAQYEWDKRCSLFMISRDKPTISRRHYLKLSDTAKRYCVPFQYRTVHGHKKTRFYVNFPKSCARFQFQRCYITHRRRIDPEIISEIEFLNSQLTRKKYYDLHKASYWWDPWWGAYLAGERRKRERKIKQNLKMLKREAIDDLVKENVLWEQN